ncbi:MAG TPA: UDP-glucose/GDP-mannose dehydrogenase family protein [Bacillota bacterium]
MFITVIGCGYVGLVTAAGLADFGHVVTVVEIDRVKIDQLNQGIIPIYEPGLETLVRRNMKKNRLNFTTDLKTGVKGAQVIFIAVGTPALPDGNADLSQVEAAVRQIAAELQDYQIIVNKSTVPVGTGNLVKQIIDKNLKAPCAFDVVSNPEFLREGSAVKDFMQPERIVIGAESQRAIAVMKEVYRQLYWARIPFIFTNLETAELIKYASNAFLATKISFINELARLCEAVNADVALVAQGMGLDSRIGPKFLNPGPGYGGSCFPKDTRALAAIARKVGVRLGVVEATVAANEGQKQFIMAKTRRVLGSLKSKTLAVLGLTFKANTDDLRESPAIYIVTELLKAGTEVKVHDPVALSEAKKIWGGRVSYCETIEAAVAGVDALIITTEWSVYQQLDLTKLKSMMKQPLLIDLRNILVPEDLQKAGFLYEGVGRGIKS